MQIIEVDPEVIPQKRLPEHDLLMRCLSHALYGAERGDAQDLEWIKSDAEHPFSFIWICKNLNLCFGKIRQGMQSGPNKTLKIISYKRRA